MNTKTFSALLTALVLAAAPAAAQSGGGGGGGGGAGAGGGATGGAAAGSAGLGAGAGGGAGLGAGTDQGVNRLPQETPNIGLYQDRDDDGVVSEGPLDREQLGAVDDSRVGERLDQQLQQFDGRSTGGSNVLDPLLDRDGAGGIPDFGATRDTNPGGTVR